MSESQSDTLFDDPSDDDTTEEDSDFESLDDDENTVATGPSEGEFENSAEIASRTVPLSETQLNEMFEEMLVVYGHAREEIEQLVKETPTYQKELKISHFLHMTEYDDDTKLKKIVDDFVDIADVKQLTIGHLQDLRCCLLYAKRIIFDYFIKVRDGISQLNRCSMAFLNPNSLDETRSNIQYELVRVIRRVFNSEGGLIHYINQPDAVKSLVMGLNSFVSVQTRAEILMLLSLITVSSQRGRWLILESLNNYKIFHRETVRFEKLGYSMHLASSLDENKNLKRDNSDFITMSLMFINALMNKGDFTTRATLRKEINLANIPTVVDRIQGLPTIGVDLRVQIQSFNAAMESNIKVKVTEDPNELSASITSKLRGLPVMSNFIHILHCLKAKAEETDFGDKAYEDWVMLDKLIAKTSTTNEQIDSLQLIRLQDKLTITEKILEKFENRERLTIKHVKLMVDRFISKASTSPLSPSSKQERESDNVNQEIIIAVQEALDFIFDRSIKKGNETNAQSPPPPVEKVPSPVLSIQVPPPPPPPPILNAPPPPPPPPVKLAPPPPPPMGTPRTPGTSDGTPPPISAFKTPIKLKPMRNMYWHSIAPTNLQKSVFIQKDIIGLANDLKLDTNKIEELFSKSDITPRSVLTPPMLNNSPRPQVVSLLDPKRSQHVAIIIKQFKMPRKDLKRALLQMDDSKLSDTDVTFLSKVVPTTEEIQKMRSYSGEKSVLSEADRFFLDLEDIADDLPKRLEAWQFKNHFYEMVSLIRPDIETVVRAVDELLASDQLHKLLSIILAIGNHLNGAKKVQGFKISSLEKLKDLKATTAGGTAAGGKNLLEYLVQFVAERDDLKELLHFSKSLQAVPMASRIDPDKLQKDLNTLSIGLEQTAKYSNIKQIGEYDQFKDKVTEFLEDGNYTYKKLLESKEEMVQKVRQLAEFFGEDPAKLVDSYAQFFIDISKFIDAFNKVRDHVLIVLARKEKNDRKFVEMKKQEAKSMAKLKADHRKSRRESINVKEMEAGLRTGALFKLRKAISDHDKNG